MLCEDYDDYDDYVVVICWLYCVDELEVMMNGYAYIKQRSQARAMCLLYRPHIYTDKQTQSKYAIVEELKSNITKRCSKSAFNTVHKSEYC